MAPHTKAMPEQSNFQETIPMQVGVWKHRDLGSYLCAEPLAPHTNEVSTGDVCFVTRSLSILFCLCCCRLLKASYCFISCRCDIMLRKSRKIIFKPNVRVKGCIFGVCSRSNLRCLHSCCLKCVLHDAQSMIEVHALSPKSSRRPVDVMGKPRCFVLVQCLSLQSLAAQAQSIWCLLC